MPHSPESIRRLLLDLVAIPSVSPDPRTEDAAVRYLRDRLTMLSCFRDHPEDLALLPCEGDPLGRSFLLALLRPRPGLRDTVILTGHIDVVGVKVCGPLAPYAFDPEGYGTRIGGMPLSPSARRDLESGEWLFGRGVADMKCGAAVATALLEDFAEEHAALETNLALLFVPDEEDSSRGMLGAVRHLARLQDGGLRFLACINTEPSIGTGDRLSDLAAVYTGSAGKINPFFFCVGREAHLGEYYEGLSAALLTSQINLLIEGDPARADRGGREALTPWACMKHRDFRQEYSCSVPERSASYYSYFTAETLPGRLLEEMRRIAGTALRLSIARTRRNARRFSRMGKPRPAALDLEPRVLTYAELEGRARAAAGPDWEAAVEAAGNALPPGSDARDRALARVDACVTLAGEKGPLVVIGYLMPWYPHRGNDGRSEGDRAMLALARDLRSFAASLGSSLSIRPYYEGISDLSYLAAPCGKADLAAFTENVPGYGPLYELPLEALDRLEVPVLNLGPVGKDAHKLSERIHEGFAFKTYPKLLRRAVLGAGKTGASGMF